MTASDAVLELTLRDCAAGDDVAVVDVIGDSAVAARLREIGMVPGATVRIVHHGNPMIVQLGNTRFCLRGNEAALVLTAISIPLPGQKTACKRLPNEA